MKKHLFYPAFFGIITLSVLSSCRTEDGAMTQKQVEDKRFAVFVPQPGKTVNYASGFAYLMQRYDNLHRTNLSGFNNNIPTIGNLTASVNKNASVSQTSVPYIEFAIHSQTVTEENGDKWVVFPKVEGEKVTGLILAILSNKETNVSYKTIDSQTEWYVFNISKFQYAFSNYLKRNKFQNLSASIKPMANGDCGDDVQRCGEIPEVVITVPKDPGTPKAPVTIITPIIDTGTCTDFQSCAPGGGGGGGGTNDLDYYENVSPNIQMKLSDQQKYPRFTKMVKNLENFVTSNPVVLKALIKNTGLTEAKVLEGLKWGKGPTVDFDKFDANKYGEYSNFSKRLIINTLYVNELEATSLASTQKTVSFLLAITVLHEYTHYGDMLADGYEGDYEMGWGFEQDILGGARLFVNRSNAGFYVKMFKF